jgi:hypothetical protein
MRYKRVWNSNKPTRGGYARTGQAYPILAVWAKSIPNGRRYLSTELETTLTAGVSYRAQFYVTLADSLWYATRNIGIHFSNTPYSQNTNDLIALTPQVSYSDSAFLTEKLEWIAVSGSFIAQGGERFLAIGNFDSDAETDTMFVPDGGTYAVQPEGAWNVSGYFIDDVSVIPDSIYLSNEELRIENDELRLYPNPTSDQLTVEIGTFSDRTVALFELSGRMVLSQPLRSARETISLGHLPRGIYVVVLKHDGALVERKKLVLQ